MPSENCWLLTKESKWTVQPNNLLLNNPTEESGQFFCFPREFKAMTDGKLIVCWVLSKFIIQRIPKIDVWVYSWLGLIYFPTLLPVGIKTRGGTAFIVRIAKYILSDLFHLLKCDIDLCISHSRWNLGFGDAGRSTLDKLRRNKLNQKICYFDSPNILLVFMFNFSEKIL